MRKHKKESREHDWLQEIPHLKKSGKVLDLGCGFGENAVFLAKNGFEVTCVDNSDIAIYETKNKAAINNAFIRIYKQDVREFKTNEKFDVALCTGVMHFLSKDEAMQLFENMQSITVKGGLNVISNLLLKNTKKERNLGYVKKNELKDIYGKWKILFYEEMKNKNSPSAHKNALIIARKI